MTNPTAHGSRIDRSEAKVRPRELWFSASPKIRTMYRLEWFEQLKLSRRSQSAAPAEPISSVVWFLGWTSLLTDISSEMVNSILPVYLVLHLHWSPLQYGVVDGIYNGLAIALLSLWAGYLADRNRRQKIVALTGYGLSAACKLLLLAAGTAWTTILLVIGLDRLGKGIRSAPRDALISLNTPAKSFASAFAVHRAMDACGSLLGPIVAFLLLARLPGAFDAVWVMSFAFAVLGVAVLWLFVPRASGALFDTARENRKTTIKSVWHSRRFVALSCCGAMFAFATISDGFLYLMMQERSATPTGFFPLFYVLTAAAYMLASVPAGRLADRTSRTAIFLSGYIVLGIIYALLWASASLSTGMLVSLLAILGLYYAATEGVLLALASAVIPAERRTIGIAIVATGIGFAKVASSVVFGWLWQTVGRQNAVLMYFFLLIGVLIASMLLLHKTKHDE